MIFKLLAYNCELSLFRDILFKKLETANSNSNKIYFFSMIEIYMIRLINATRLKESNIKNRFYIVLFSHIVDSQISSLMKMLTPAELDEQLTLLKGIAISFDYSISHIVQENVVNLLNAICNFKDHKVARKSFVHLLKLTLHFLYHKQYQQLFSEVFNCVLSLNSNDYMKFMELIWAEDWLHYLNQ